MNSRALPSISQIFGYLPDPFVGNPENLDFLPTIAIYFWKEKYTHLKTNMTLENPHFQ